MKKVIGEIFYEENKRLKIITKIIRFHYLIMELVENIFTKKSKKYEEIIEKIIEKTFDDENNKLFSKS